MNSELFAAAKSGLPIRLFLAALFPMVAGCSFLDRQQVPEILEVRTDRETTVGRGQEIKITLVTDDPDNDELDYRWIASGGEFTSSRQDTIVDLFQDSVTVTWKAPSEVGVYDLFVEVSDGKTEKLTTTDLQVSVTQSPPFAIVGSDQFLAYLDSLDVALDASESGDPDGDDLNYYWRQIRGPSVQLANRNSPSPSFQAVAPADYVFELTVADDRLPGGDTSDVVTVQVRVSDRGGRDP